MTRLKSLIRSNVYFLVAAAGVGLAQLVMPNPAGADAGCNHLNACREEFGPLNENGCPLVGCRYEYDNGLKVICQYQC